MITLALVATLMLVPVTSTSAPKPDQPSQFYGHRTGDQSWQWKWRVWLPDKWRRIATCETPITVNGVRQMNWRHSNSSYQGAFGFAISSWDGFKPVAWWPDEAWMATPWQQYRTALAIHARYGFSGWGCRNA